MNHPHNKDECRIQRSGRQNIAFADTFSKISAQRYAEVKTIYIYIYINIKREYYFLVDTNMSACVWHLNIVCCIKNPRDLSAHVSFHRVWRPPTLTVHKNLATWLDPLMFSPPSLPRSPSFLMPLIIHAVYTVCPFLVAQAPPELVNCVGDTGPCVKQQ